MDKKDKVCADDIIAAVTGGILDSLTGPERFRLRLVQVAKQRERVRRLQRLYRKGLVAWTTVVGASSVLEDMIDAELRLLARESGRSWLGVDNGGTCE